MYFAAEVGHHALRLSNSVDRPSTHLESHAQATESRKQGLITSCQKLYYFDPSRNGVLLWLSPTTKGCLVCRSASRRNRFACLYACRWQLNISFQHPTRGHPQPRGMWRLMTAPSQPGAARSPPWWERCAESAVRTLSDGTDVCGMPSPP